VLRPKRSAQAEEARKAQAHDAYKRWTASKHTRSTHTRKAERDETVASAMAFLLRRVDAQIAFREWEQTHKPTAAAALPAARKPPTAAPSAAAERARSPRSALTPSEGGGGAPAAQPRAFKSGSAREAPRVRPPLPPCKRTTSESF
jgi:hypothetical protein